MENIQKQHSTIDSGSEFHGQNNKPASESKHGPWRKICKVAHDILTELGKSAADGDYYAHSTQPQLDYRLQMLKE